MQAAAVLFPWYQAPSPSRTPVTPRAAGRFALTMPTGPTAASLKTAVDSICLKSLEDDTQTRSAPSQHKKGKLVKAADRELIENVNVRLSR